MMHIPSISYVPPKEVFSADMTRESQKSDGPVIVDAAHSPAPLQTVGWMVTPPTGRSWVTDDNPERYRILGYTITPLVEAKAAQETTTAAVEEENRKCKARHANDLVMLAHIFKRLRTIIENKYDYDNMKIRDDLRQWGLIEPNDRRVLLPTKEGRRLENVLELEWLRTKARRGLR
ncbi:hypothetical protein [Acetobacter oeni]|uniref:Uncharacterized protein n=1 Tax=Acetobacter oeni TaxID=304077 RepID=A0A511XPU5_9PROT|nr:hypothetical protein [Acetobacter oeni]MBB3883642.1 hypothetical protein [Acetobacter oeni]NHO19627.1 hypothetical protein [Acetobacter oeni]GBR09976.1 hypothetical protein AA21952_2969 [Acetobacter oeni LMG 21952]GEN64980.1 hypothetical protein AOE01nite_32040 [Acetobacter oeni]